MQDYLGKHIKKLGFGLMRLPTKGDEFDMDQINDMVDVYMKNGFSYFDTAYVYGGGKSEVVAREALVKRYPRESFQLASKLPMWLVETKEDMERFFNESLERAGVEYFDYYLLHGLSATKSDRFVSSSIAKADEYGAWDFIKQKKQAGQIKHMGFSFHDTADVLDEMLTAHPEMEFVQLQINYADWNDETIQARKNYEVAMKHKVPVIIMEPVKGGTLVSLRPEVEEILSKADRDASIASWAIRYAASLDGLVTVLSGMSTMEQMEDNISYMTDFRPLCEQEHGVIDKVVEALQAVDSIGCTGCRYCTDDCPQSINIPAIFDQVNDYSVYKDLVYTKRRYGNTVAEGGKASDCIECGLCENHCPQKLKITQLLKNAATLLDA